MTEKSIGNDGPKLLFTCSGASNVGEIADLAARKLFKEGVVRMSCIASIGGRIESQIAHTKNSPQVIALDGCDKDCVKNALKHTGLKPHIHIRLSDIGMIKGGTLVNEESIDKVVQHTKKSL